MEQQRYSARRAFKYNGTELDRGQVMRLVGSTNDEKLTRLGFLTGLDSDQRLFTCRLCGAEFISERQRTKHGDRAHAEDPVERAVAALEAAPAMTKEQGQTAVNRIMNDPDYEPALVPDETISSRDEENEQEAPIHFDKTEASVRSGAGAIEVVGGSESKDESEDKPTFRTRKPPIPETGLLKLTGADLEKWRVSQSLSRPQAAAILGVGVGSFRRAEKLLNQPLGPKLAPALWKVLDANR